MPELLPSTRKLMENYLHWQQSLQKKEGVPMIHVDEVASSVAAFYEKLRGIVDWKEEHLLRKTAIERVLKRRFFLKKDGKEIAEPLVHELVRGGHFPNDSIPEEKISEVQKSIDKYVIITENAVPPKEKTKIRLYDWILNIAACEIEEILSPPLKEEALMNFMMGQMKNKIEVMARSHAAQNMTEEEKDTQIYVAIQRALFKLDNPLISYNLLKRWYRQWLNLPGEQIEEVANSIYFLWKKIEENLNHPLSDKFYNVCERKDTAYLILGDVIAENPSTVLENSDKSELLENKIREAYILRLKKVKARLGRAAIYSTLSILLTKMMMAFAIEVPFDKYVTSNFNNITIGINILIPPLLMFLLVLSIRPPSKKNEELVVLEVMKIAYEREGKEVYAIKPTPKRGLILNLIIGFLYLLSFGTTFGLIFWGLQKLNFSLLSIAVFIVFVSLISFAGVKLRQRAKELVIEEKSDSFLRTLIDLFFLPIVQVGKWISGQWTKYNAMTVLINSLLDMPLQVFVEFLEQWRLFLKEKKEKIH